MARIIAKNTSGGADFKPLPSGAHFALCHAVIDLGLQPGYQGEKAQRKVHIRWEVPDERVEYKKDGAQVRGPMSIGKTYTLSLNEKATLRAHLEAWRGRTFTDQELGGFDIANLIGKAVQLMVIHKASPDGKMTAKISGLMGLSKDQRDRARTAQLENEPLLFSIDEWDDAAYARLPNWAREQVQSRLDPVSASAAATQPAVDFNDDVPF